ncbi:MAG TPA: phospholipid carrier-dependent glycosyltransferase [Steroidobacteraceae bacterium]|nr:phospholipid carrier-dependent glycosyltransferase [Steroidobacteraceae bacterium]
MTPGIGPPAPPAAGRTLGPGAARARPARRAALALALLAVATSWLVLCGLRPLFNPDEGRYAEIPREMLASGDWVIPRLDGLMYIEKPPLQYWATAVAYILFGESDWSARLYTALCGLATVLVSAGLARRLWGAAAAWRTGIMLGSSLLVALLSHQLTLDMSLTLFMTGTLAAFCLAQDEGADPRARRRWMALAWASAAGAFLTKGLVAGVLPVLALAAYSALHRDLKPWMRLAPVAGLVLFLLLALPWFVLIQHRLPSFFDFFVVREHFQRYLTLVEARYEPWWFFLEVLALGALPWIVPAARALAGGWRASAPAGRFDVRRLLWVWSVVVLVFFSTSDSKLIPYILPMFPPLALLMGSAAERPLRADLRATGAGLVVAGLALALATLLLPRLLHDPARAPYFLATRAPLIAIALACVAGGLLARRLRGGSLALTVAVGATGYAVFIGISWAAALLAPIYSGGPLVAQLSPALRAVATVYSVRMYDQSLPFYLKRTVTLVEYRGELNFGLTLEPRKAIATLAAFEPRWRTESQALAVMQPPTFAALARAGVPMVLRARTPNELIVSRR